MEWKQCNLFALNIFQDLCILIETFDGFFYCTYSSNMVFLLTRTIAVHQNLLGYLEAYTR